jgi:hypothetical protein
MKQLFLAVYCFCLLVIFVPDNYPNGIASQAIRKKEAVSVLNNIWTIESAPPADMVESTGGFLPPGTKVQIKIAGPTRLAIEEGRTDELGGEIILLPPFPQNICTVGLGTETIFGGNLCEKGQLKDPARPVSFDSQFVFERWEHPSDTEQLDNGFFVDQGAKLGAQFVLVNPLHKGVDWQLWVRDRDTLIGSYIATLRSKETERVVQIWRRVKAP